MATGRLLLFFLLAAARFRCTASSNGTTGGINGLMRQFVASIEGAAEDDGGGGVGECSGRITSPVSGELWTSSFLTIEWRACGIEGKALVALDGVTVAEVWTSSNRGRIVVWSIPDGPHDISINFPDSPGTVLSSHFISERGESLLGGMARRNPQPPPRRACGEDDITLVTAALDIGRRHGNTSFVDDYIGNLHHLLALGCRIVIHIEGKHAHLLEGYMHPLASLLITELDDLRSFKHHSEVERLRSSPEWPGGRMKYNPAAMPLYNSLVMSKLYWLDEVAAKNPFGTRHFLWIDAGLCVRFVIPPLTLSSLWPYMHLEKFVIFSMHHQSPGGMDVHGFPSVAYDELLGRRGWHPGHLVRGNIFGGSAGAVRAALDDYDDILNRTLSRGHMGTEESALTAACVRNASLCHVVSVSDNSLGTEMPCSMFLLISSRGPSVELVHPARGSQHPPEGVVACLRARFPPHPARGGRSCVSWEDGFPDSAGRHCIEASVLEEDTWCTFVGGLPLGVVTLRAELVTGDGLPVASGEAVEIHVEPSAPEETPPGEGDEPHRGEPHDFFWDSLADVASLAAARGRKENAAAVVGSGCEAFADELKEARYPGEIRRLEWGARPKGDADEGVDTAYLCAPPGARRGEVGDAIQAWEGVLALGGVLAGGHYFEIAMPRWIHAVHGDIHGVKAAVDAYAKGGGRVLHTTQERRGRTWFFASEQLRLVT